MMRLQYWVGLGGVCKLENKPLRVLSKTFQVLMILVGVLLLSQWHFELLKLWSAARLQAINLGVWLFFVIQWLVFMLFVKDRFRYLRENWLIGFIIIVDIPLVFMAGYYDGFYLVLKPILAVILFVPWLGFVKLTLSDNRLATTLVSVAVVVVLAGVLISGIDPAIKSPAEGIWWAWVTMSTVGFGDLVPVSLAGRIFASVIILIGLCFFAILTANFSSMFIRRDVSRFKSQEEKDAGRIVKRIRDVEVRDREILRILQRIEQRLGDLEKQKKP